MNTDNEQLLVRTLGDGLLCVNGCKVGDAGQLLCDGDRLGIEGAHIFQAQLPKKPKDEGMASFNGSEFERAMGEVSACAEVDPLRKNGTQKTMLIVTSDFGIEDATQLLQQTTNASGCHRLRHGEQPNEAFPRQGVERNSFFPRSAN